MSAVTVQEIVDGLRKADKEGRQELADFVGDLITIIEQHGIAPPDGWVFVKRDNELLEDIEFLLSQKMSAECCNAAFPVNSLTRVLKSCKAMLAAAPEVSNER